MSDTDRPVISALSDPEASDPARTGGKGANLATLVQAGLPVPAGFAVCTSAYRRFVREHRLDIPIGREMSRLGDDPASAEAASQQPRQEVEEISWRPPGARPHHRAAAARERSAPPSVCRPRLYRS